MEQTLEIDENWFKNNIKIRDSNTFTDTQFISYDISGLLFTNDNSYNWCIEFTNNYVFIFEENQYDKIFCDIQNKYILFIFNNVTELLINPLIPYDVFDIGNYNYEHEYLNYFSHFEQFIL